jgi:thiamine-phosphate pyrophosphorylase
LKSFAQLAGRGLYVITDGPRSDLLEVAAQALAGGAQVMQYRDKTDDTARRKNEAGALVVLCKAHGVPLIINSDLALAQAIGAAGVHLGPDDVGLAVARKALGAEGIIGVSCLASMELAKAAALGGASYISFGAFFQSQTKPLAGRASSDLLRQSDALGLPRVAIGGITPENAKLLIEAGADFVASVSGVFGARDARAAAQEFSNLFT